MSTPVKPTDFIVELPSNLENCPDENSQQRAQRYVDFFNQTQREIQSSLVAQIVSVPDASGNPIWKARIFSATLLPL